MIRMTFSRPAMAVCALLLAATVSAPAQAASAPPPLPQSTAVQAGSGLTEVGYDRHRHRYGHRYGHRGGLRFFFAPVIVGGGYYGYDRYRRSEPGPSCYSICREERGPEYCRYNWRRYC